MRTAHTLVLLAAAITSLAQADVYIEIDFAGFGPNGQTAGDLVIGDPTPLSVWIWADEPELHIRTLSIQINGQSQQGIPNSGGSLTFDSLGTADPDNHFPFFATPGILNGDQTIITDVAFSNFFVINEPLPTSMETAWLIYTDFTGTALEAGAGVMPTVFSLTFNEDGTGTPPPPQTVHTYGLYQTPAPSGAMTIGLGLLWSTRRRR